MVNCLCVSTCGKSFVSSQTLCSHEQSCKTCGNKVKYRCGKCNKLFSTVYFLKLHEMVHSDVKRFKCGVCDQTFKRRSDCNRHVKEIHYGARNFKCHICDQCFSRKSSCSRHVEGHLGIRNYKCVKCDKSFRRYNHARRHEDVCRQNDVSVSDSFSDDGGSNITDDGVTNDEQADVTDTDRFTSF